MYRHLSALMTMKSDFYQKAFRQYNLNVITPNKEDMIIINKIIWEELTHHILNRKSKKQYLEIIQRLKEKGGEGVILGCTEIPLLVSQNDCNIPVFDTTKIHALATLKYAMEDK